MSLISKKHLSMAIQSLKDVFNRKIKESKADWNQNDVSADNYVKNRTHWEETNRITFVDNLTMEDYFDGNNVPKCNFVPDQTYDVVWNGTLYEGLVCWFDGEYNVIATPDDGYPFYIDDDGGDGLYIGGELDEDENMLPFTVSIMTTETVIHKLDSKYLPEVGVKSWNDLEDKPFSLNETVLFEDTITTDQYGNYQNNALQAYSATSYIVTIGDKQYVSTPTYIEPDGTGIYLMDGSECHGSIVAGYLWLSTNYYPPSSSYYVKLSSAEIQKIDEKFLPDNVAMDEDVRSAQTAANNAQTAANNAQSTADSKMDKTNPVGTGSFSMNRKADTTVGGNSHAEGNNNTASGWFTHAEGSGTTASGTNAHAEGFYTIASGHTSHAEGYQTEATGDYAHSEGYNSKASGNYAHAEGMSILASSSYQHVQGKWNIEDTKVKHAHIVGNGTSKTARSNAHTLDWSGNAWYSGDVYVGSTSGTNRDEGSKKLATEEYVRSAHNQLVLTDEVNGYKYLIKMHNGNLVSICAIASIEVTTMPIQTEYISGEPFDPTGMVVTATCQDGTTRVVEGCEYDLVTTDNASAFEIRYTEVDTTYTTTIALTILDVGSSLSDFTYTIEEDGTYTLTGWNGTLNGVESTECIIPDSDKINL